MDSDQESDDPRRKQSGVHYDSPPLGKPFIRQPDAEGTVHESEDELNDVDSPEGDAPVQEEDTGAPAAEEFPPPPESMAMEENEEKSEESDPGYGEPQPNELDEETEADTSPLVNGETADPPIQVVTVVTVPEDDHNDDDVELHEVSEPPPSEPSQENAAVSNNPGRSLAYAPSVRAKYVQRHIEYNEEEKDMYTKLCWSCVILVLLASFVGFLIAVVVIPNREPSLSSTTVTEGSAGDLALAEVTVTLDLNFSNDLYISSSEQFRELEVSYLEWVQQIIRETSFAEDVFGAFVNGFRPGSVVVYSSVFFNMSNNTMMNLESNLDGELKRLVLEQKASSSLPVEEVAVDRVIRYSGEPKRQIEIFAAIPTPSTSTSTPQKNQTTVTSSTQRNSTTPQITAASNSTLTTSNNVTQSLHTDMMTSSTTSPGMGMTSTGMQATSNATQSRTNLTTANPSS